MFLLVPDYTGSPGQRAIKWLCVSVLTYLAVVVLVLIFLSMSHII